jgi:hypothetical protein
MPESPHIDYENPLNAEILHCLDLPLGEASPELSAYFKECVTGLTSKQPDGLRSLKGHTVYADPDTGVVLAALFGTAGAAFRLMQIMRGNLVKQGGKSVVDYAGGQFSLAGTDGYSGTGWIVSDGTLKSVIIAAGLVTMQSLLREIKRMPVSSRPGLPAPEVHPANQAVLNYLKPLAPNPDASPMLIAATHYGPHGGYHPDISDFIWHTLPQMAKVEPRGWLLYTRMGLVHPDNNVICAFMLDEGRFGMRLPEASRTEAITLGAQPYTEIDAEWIRFPLFNLQAKSPGWLHESFHYAATL